MVTIIMPTYNESGNIKDLILRTQKALKRNCEIIVVDDDSPDGTADVVRSLPKSKNLRLVVRKNVRGLPGAIKKGIDLAKGDMIGWLDCALDMPPEKFLQMITLMKKYDLIVGSTFVKGGKDNRGEPISAFFSRVVNIFCQLTLGWGITDYTSGFILVKKEAIPKDVFDGVHGSYFIKLLVKARKNGVKIKEVPYTLGPRSYGKSKIAGMRSYFAAGKSYLVAIWQARSENL